MSKLLRANFSRLKYSLAFWVCVIVSGFTGLFDMLMSYFNSFGQPFSLVLLFFCGSNIMLFAAAFIPLFIGTEYSELTMRNKLVVGHTKTSIYLSNLITSTVCTFIIYTVYWLPAVVVGLFLGGEINVETNKFWGMFFINALAIMSVAALYVMSAMIISKKSSSVTTVLVGTFILIFASVIFESVSIRFEVPSEAVLSIIALFFREVLPFGQITQIEMGSASGMFPVYSLAVTAVSTAMGMFIFRRKDLK